MEKDSWIQRRAKLPEEARALWNRVKEAIERDCNEFSEGFSGSGYRVSFENEELAKKLKVVVQHGSNAPSETEVAYDSGTHTIRVRPGCSFQICEGPDGYHFEWADGKQTKQTKDADEISRMILAPIFFPNLIMRAARSFSKDQKFPHFPLARSLMVEATDYQPSGTFIAGVMRSVP